MSKKEKVIDYGAELEELYERWDHLYEHGGSDPTWSDGSNGNLLRSHIIYCKRKIEEENSLFLLPDCFYREIPPELPNDYMARADEIRENARKAMEIIDADENLKFVREQSKSLSEKQLKRLCIPAVIGYAESLRLAISEDDLIAMRMYENPKRYLESFESAAQNLRSQEILNSANEQCSADDEEEFEEMYDECDEIEPVEIEEIPSEESLESENISELDEEPREDFQLTFF